MDEKAYHNMLLMMLFLWEEVIQSFHKILIYFFLAVKEIPDVFIDQLAPGGSLVRKNEEEKK